MTSKPPSGLFPARLVCLIRAWRSHARSCTFFVLFFFHEKIQIIIAPPLPQNILFVSPLPHARCVFVLVACLIRFAAIHITLLPPCSCLPLTHIESGYRRLPTPVPPPSSILKGEKGGVLLAPVGERERGRCTRVVCTCSMSSTAATKIPATMPREVSSCVVSSAASTCASVCASAAGVRWIL